MLDESMFDDIQEIAENSAYLKAVEEKNVSMEMMQKLPPYEECKDIEERLKQNRELDFDTVFHEPLGYYMIKCFLLADYAVDKAVFIKDCERYRTMRFPSARRKVAQLLYQRFVAMRDLQDGEEKWQKGQSVFDMIKARQEDEREQKQSARHGSRMHGGHTSGRTSEHSRSGRGINGTDPDPLSPSSRNSGSRPLDGEGTGAAGESVFQMGSMNNSIGVYGEPVQRVKEMVLKGEAPADLFNNILEIVVSDLKLDAFPRFLKSEFYKKFIRTKWIEIQPVHVKDFTTFRVLGRGGFGAVHACRKKDSGTIYAMKCINKKLVKVKSALKNVMAERDVLTQLNSKFITNLKYALQDENTLYIVMDLMLGGDLKFHLINAGRFSEKRARFYAAEVLLGLEHIHSKKIIYRDLKLENVLLDRVGHCRLSDLGLAVMAEGKIKGYAGTPGYTAPEMIKNKRYGPSVDLFSFGVLLYRMLCGSKPFKGKTDRDLDKAVLEKTPVFSREIFSKSATSLLFGLLQKRPDDRLGCGERRIQEIKDHAFFESIDWGLLEAGYMDPPFVPSKLDVNAASLKDIGDFDTNKYKNVKLGDDFHEQMKKFDFTSKPGIQEEMVRVLEYADQNTNFEKFSTQSSTRDSDAGAKAKCCSVT
eukprot:gb/GEZN01002461.1/.p1 GENE.gb/GEZN01002461.1/~~gb/GEZN01002461.1/.p1  ORF type:complete len:645 (-),score=124.53 gb/GEZN01002461.1/:421-2355(-)